MPTTVCVLYGFGEGPRVGQRLQKALQASGYEVIDDPAQADIIITHSAGCLLLPEKVRARQIIQIGPYWPERTWLKAATRKFIDDMHKHHREGELRFWLHKSLWNLTYFCRMPTNFRFLKGLKEGRHWRHGKITTVVRPRYDSFCAVDPKSRFKQPPAFLSFPGHHDDCWRDPKPYIALLK
jgi:hypothetical protein